MKKKLSSQKVFLFDMDNTLYNFSESLENKLKEKWDQMPEEISSLAFVPKEKRTHFEIYNCFTTDKNLQGVLEKEMKNIYQTFDFYQNLALYPWVSQELYKIMEHGYIQICSTASSKNFGSEEAKRYALQRDFTDLYGSKIGKKIAREAVFASDKTSVKGTYLIDDKKDIGKGKHIPERVHIMMNQPYNQDKKNIIRTNGYDIGQVLLG